MKIRNRIRICNIAIVILLLALTRTALSYYQHSRYDVIDYNCTHMSGDCEEFFEGLGLRTQMVYGDNRPNNGHAWIRVHTILGVYDFEPTSLSFKNVSENYKNIIVTEGVIK